MRRHQSRRSHLKSVPLRGGPFDGVFVENTGSLKKGIAVPFEKYEGYFALYSWAEDGTCYTFDGNVKNPPLLGAPLPVREPPPKPQKAPRKFYLRQNRLKPRPAAESPQMPSCGK